MISFGDTRGVPIVSSPLITIVGVCGPSRLGKDSVARMCAFLDRHPFFMVMHTSPFSLNCQDRLRPSALNLSVLPLMNLWRFDCWVSS